MKAKVYIYQELTDDVVSSHDQDYQLPTDYRWDRDRLNDHLIHNCLAVTAATLSYLYCRYWRMIKFVGRDKLKPYRHAGYVMYGNHTQQQGDVFVPLFLMGSHRFNAIASQANLGIPILGRLLPYMGVVPTPERRHQLRTFEQVINQRIQSHQHLLIYPEAHLWPYATEIRPFVSGAFHFPVSQGVPVFVATTTYHPRWWSFRPGITVYIDGPFVTNYCLPKKQQQRQLEDQVRHCMEERARNNTVQYVHYQSKG